MTATANAQTATGTMAALARLPRVHLGHKPTPMDAAPRLAAALGLEALHVKRDDCTGLAFGGNKVRQLEFYLGEAAAQGADTVLITGAVQSNFVRLAAAAARTLGMDCHIQLEHRVADRPAAYHTSGNVLLDKLLGATLYEYPVGEDEEGADRRLHEIADGLRDGGATPFVIPLAPGHAPLGALGYVAAAEEILADIDRLGIAVDEIVVASGSGHTHGGLLYGLRALGVTVPVTGVCVRRPASAQAPRIANRCREIAELLGEPSPVSDDDVVVIDDTLAPGYGLVNDATREAIAMAAHNEGLLLDPTYTGKSMAGLIARARAGTAKRMLFVHTGGQPALFAYPDELF